MMTRRGELRAISGELDESFVPKPPDHGAQREIPRDSAGPGRPAPGR
jgi:hypothetical protein